MCKPEVPKLAHAHTFCRGVDESSVFESDVSGIPREFFSIGEISSRVVP